MRWICRNSVGIITFRRLDNLMNRTIYTLFFAFVLSALAEEPLPKKSQFMPTKLPGGISLDVPRGWEFTGPDEKRLLDRYAQSIWDLTKIPYGRAGMLLGANAPDDGGYISLTVVLEYRKVATQQELQNIPPTQLAQIDKQNREDIEAGSQYNGLKIISWSGTAIEKIGSQSAMVKRYTYQLPGQQPRVMENCEFFLGDRLVSLILQHGEHTLIPSKPILERIKSSIRFE